MQILLGEASVKVNLNVFIYRCQKYAARVIYHKDWLHMQVPF